MLWMFQRVNYGPVTNEKNAALPDLRPREWVVLVPIVALAVLMGVLPNLFLRPMEPSVERMLDQVRGTPTVAQSSADRIAAVRSAQLNVDCRRFNAIVPMACVTAAAIAAMAAEAFRAPGERMPIGPLGVIGLVGAALSRRRCSGTATRPASASSSPTTSACSSPGS